MPVLLAAQAKRQVAPAAVVCLSTLKAEHQLGSQLSGGTLDDSLGVRMKFTKFLDGGASPVSRDLSPDLHVTLQALCALSPRLIEILWGSSQCSAMLPFLSPCL